MIEQNCGEKLLLLLFFHLNHTHAKVDTEFSCQSSDRISKLQKQFVLIIIDRRHSFFAELRQIPHPK